MTLFRIFSFKHYFSQKSFFTALLCGMILTSLPVHAQTASEFIPPSGIYAEEDAPVADQTDVEQTAKRDNSASSNSVAKGRSTGLAIPRFVSLTSGKTYLRRGPSKTQMIDWVYQRQGMPVEIVDEFEYWRKIRDFEGTQGWVHKRLLSSKRTAVALEEAIVRSSPTQTSNMVAKLEKGVVMNIIRCNDTWCQVDNIQSSDEKTHFKGWLLKSGLWGIKPTEYLND